MPSADPKSEYLDASSNQRQFQTLRFAQLTVFLAIVGGFFNLLFSGSATSDFSVRTFIKAGGLILTLVFWVQQERTQTFWTHFVRRAAELEEELGYKQYSTRPASGIFSSFKVMRLFFLLLALFWIASFFWIA